MKKHLLAVGFENYSNYIKLPESVLIELNKPKTTDIIDDYNYFESKNKKRIDLQKQLNFSNDINILPPYYFSIETTYSKFTYCGVQDFTADEGIVMIPHCILENLDVNGSDFVNISYIGNIPKGDFVQLEPIQKEIFNIPELDKFLEKVISNYCLLYPEQIITCSYSNTEYNIKVKSIKSIYEFDIEPELIDIVNTDLKFDIFNKFLEEELKEKARIEELKEKARIEELKEKARIEEEKRVEIEKTDNGLFNGTGLKLGGCGTLDPVLMKEIRLQRLLNLQSQLQVQQLTQHNLDEKTLQNQTIVITPQNNSVNLDTHNKNIIKSSKKSKDIEV